MVEFFAETFTPFCVASQPKFRKLFDISNKRITVKDRTTYARLVESKAQSVRQRMYKIVEACNKGVLGIAFTTDMWTSRAHDSYMSFTAHFLDENFNLYRWTPNVVPFEKRHTGITIEHVFSKRKGEFLAHLPSTKCETVVNDHGANIVLAIELCENCDEYFCSCHTLDLPINDAFEQTFGMAKALGKCKGLATLCNMSDPINKRIKQQCVNQSITYKSLKNPGDTRWK